MNKFLKSLLFLVVFSITLNAQELESYDSYEDAIAMGKKTNKSVVLFAHSPFCPWCKKMEENTLSDDKVINVLNDKFIFVTVDLSLDLETDEVPDRFLPRGTPTTYVINPNNEQLLFTMRGYKTSKSFLSRVTR